MYINAFGAEELKRVMYAKRKAEQELPLILAMELKLGSSVFLVSDQAEDSDVVGSTVFCLETDDVDGSVNKGVAAGATIIGDISDDGYGGISGLGIAQKPTNTAWSQLIDLLM
ncbi:uncharacterized protein At5g48480-like [Telopea speciosissima]|uniref:uncharacterized protein At5g48480-like n=1 Tax=Telopea speciosissima TaxID=54955 RepID=UPI001CC41A67|nr:uncharacterized protein At5g48480-like [Telopea speciosissima]